MLKCCVKGKVKGRYLELWNIRSHVLSLPGAKVPQVTFDPMSQSNVKLSLPNTNYQ